MCDDRRKRYKKKKPHPGDRVPPTERLRCARVYARRLRYYWRPPAINNIQIKYTIRAPPPADLCFNSHTIYEQPVRDTVAVQKPLQKGIILHSTCENETSAVGVRAVEKLEYTKGVITPSQWARPANVSRAVRWIALHAENEENKKSQYMCCPRSKPSMEINLFTPSTRGFEVRAVSARAGRRHCATSAIYACSHTSDERRQVLLQNIRY
ncbi:hypothetical protein EVAR_77547_1 [Eumeta japonica]|uniref:Uncharacterized protein n=1 Tax=Eumeta variegata TaxID=151549 RepID=A0A4C1T988_EUMVA|nr:hypothetical protein EVAR_77547_1 [Eumeta japonica]